MTESLLYELCRGHNILYGSDMYKIAELLANKDITPITDKVWLRTDLCSANACLSAADGVGKYVDVPFDQIDVKATTPLGYGSITDFMIEACIAFNYIDGLTVLLDNTDNDLSDLALYVCDYDSIDACKLLCTRDAKFSENVSDRAVWDWREKVLRYLLDSGNFVTPTDPNVLFSACTIVSNSKLPAETIQLAKRILN